MTSAHFTAEHDAFRREVRRFLETEVAPNAEAWEAARRIPRDIFTRMGELGFLGISQPESLGGTAADLFYSVAFLEELPRSRMGGFCAAVSVQQFMATRHILDAGSDDLKRRYVAPSIAGNKVGALAITEPDTGSDVAAIRTTAVRDNDHYLVNGAKTFITNGADGDFATVAVRTGPGEGADGLSLVVIDTDTPGVTVSRRLEKLGWHSSDTAELVYDNVRVPITHRIGDEGAGFYLIMQAFAVERLAAAAIAVGSADLALETTLAYLAERTAFGRPLNRFQALRHRLADLAAELEAARQLTHHTAWLIQNDHPAVRESAMAKLVTTELGKRVADECLQCFGGYGYMEEYPAARLYRDARGATITAGTSEIMREIIAKITIDEFAPTTPPPPKTAEPEPAAPVPPARGATQVERVARSLPSRLIAAKAVGWTAMFHFIIKGADMPEWTVRIDDGTCMVDAGLIGDADCVVRTSQKTFLGIETGKTNPQAAFLMGKIKVSDLGAMMKFVDAFETAENDV